VLHGRPGVPALQRGTGVFYLMPYLGDDTARAHEYRFHDRNLFV
jgi:hypothetical protein